MSLTILNADITTLHVDAIVNAANPQLAAGGGVCGAIFRAAGRHQLQAVCDKLAPIQTGEAVITPGFNLPAKFIIHTSGPVWRGGRFGEENLLRACYINSLKRAVEYNLKTVAFPLISAGIYGYPPLEALKVAAKTLNEAQGELDVTLTVLDDSLIAEFRRWLRESRIVFS